MALANSQEDVNSVTFTYPFLAGVEPTTPPSTISIPRKYLDAMANMERQYWDIKAQHYNVMLFFKKGKFYELYDYDAVIANREFGLKMVFDTTNRGKMRLAGVPEQSYNEWARLFVFRGYKVGRVEQMKESESEAQAAKMKIVPRELVEVLTPGTLKDPSMLSDHREVFVLSLAPIRHGGGQLGIDAFAVDLSRRVAHRCTCVPRAAVSVKVEQMAPSSLDDTALRALSALLQQLSPKEVILPGDGWADADPELQPFFERTCTAIAKWSESEGFAVEAIRRALPPQLSPSASPAEQVMASYFKTLCLEGDVALFAAATLYTAHLSGVGGPASAATTAEATSDAVCGRQVSLVQLERRFDKGLVLDATTVSNLEVLTNLHDGTEKHSLNECLNRCSTNGGRRLFRSWLLRPSASARVIAARQDAVRFLAQCNLLHSLRGTEESEQVGVKRSRSEETSCLVSAVVSVDLERFLSRLSDMKQNGSQNIAYVDPMVQYKKNLGLILSSVQALSAMVGWGKQFMARCCAVASEEGRQVPALLVELLGEVAAAESSTTRIEGLFDRKAAEESGLLVPAPGTSHVFDEATARLKRVEEQLHDARRQLQHNVFRGSQLHFSDLGKDLFLVEVAVADAPKMTPPGMVERARNSKSVKYVVASLESLVEAHKEATAMRAGALLTVLCSVASRICDEFPRLFSASHALSYTDCLLSLAQLHKVFPTVCYPQLCVGREGDSGAAAEVRGCDMVHPLLAARGPVANSVTLDDTEGRVLLLTGPNMAGKSTLMRTVAINVLMAQLGGPVLATKMELSPVDRIFTRIGARDASQKGQSTLYVELSETADILHSAGARSLCLVDELGRGTSTHDGMAIAHATLATLTATKPAAPLTIFSTHYHALAMEQARTETAALAADRHARAVQLGYMDFVLKAEPTAPLAAGDADGGNGSCATGPCVSSVVFLYRLVRGICARSYGVEVALMAGIPHTLVQLAKSRSEALSRETAFHEDVRAIDTFLCL
ncbi:DNA mismatch repair protein MSH6 [Novymonas esmeraldas]|uniref:DNA mismatch repair protein MSH6 n=1 Tax=Novymonas esmeraldas TaxID=1808958 RepID=A0AAW0F2P3_9TRYP